jgi:signal transduction histidine kinase
MSFVPKLFRTTTFRLSVLNLVLFATAASVAIAYIYWNTSGLIARQLEGVIQAEIQGLAEQYRAGGMARLTKTVAERSQTPGESLYLVTDRNGRYIAGNLTSITPGLWNAVGQIEFVYQRGNGAKSQNRLALANVFRLRGGYRLIVGRDIEERRAFERVILSAVLWGLGLMGLIGLGGGLLVSRNLLARIDKVTATSQTIMAGDLSERISVSGVDDELDRLSESLNAMLDRIEQLMTGLREVSDNIAHDLKTPLNRLRNRVEDALRAKSGAAAYRDVLERTIEEADDLINTFNALLSIARLEAGTTEAARDQIDLAELVSGTVELYEPLAEESGMKLETRLLQKAQISGDRQLLAQALSNLIDNAIKYGKGRGKEQGDPIVIDLKKRGDQFEIAVADRGPGIEARDRKRVLERFVRLETSRSRPGSGLGLSLAAAVARLHSGEIRLANNKPGLRVVISLPASGAAEPTET